MSEDIKQELKKKVSEFARVQPGYNKKHPEKIRVFDNENSLRIIFGEDEMAGFLGFGDTPDVAYESFIKSWKRLKGFAWVEKNR